MALAGWNRAVAALVISAMATSPVLAADVRPGQSTPSVAKVTSAASVSRAATPTRNNSQLLGTPLLLALLGVTVVVVGLVAVVSKDDDGASPQ